jgi:hypothetical protein
MLWTATVSADSSFLRRSMIREHLHPVPLVTRTGSPCRVTSRRPRIGPRAGLACAPLHVSCMVRIAPTSASSLRECLRWAVCRNLRRFRGSPGRRRREQPRSNSRAGCRRRSPNQLSDRRSVAQVRLTLFSVTFCSEYDQARPCGLSLCEFGVRILSNQ